MLIGMAIELHTDHGGGNGWLLDISDTDAAQVRFAAEPRNCPEALWFHIRLTGLAGRSIRVILANPEQTLGGADWSGNRPAVRIDAGRWHRGHCPVPVTTPGGRTEWAWQLEPGAETIELAACFPYQPADLQQTLVELEGAFRTELLGLTGANRRIVRVYNRPADRSHPSVYLTARNHAGETPGSWVLDGLLRAVAGDTRLREGLTVWAAPFVDLDDVVEGSYGKDPWPHDCNRSWGPGVPARAEVRAVFEDIHRLHGRSDLAFFCDLHAPSHRERNVYVPLRGWDQDSVVSEQARRFAESFAAHCPSDLRSVQPHVTPPRGHSRHAGLSASRWARDVLGVDAACLETSYQGLGGKIFSVADYRRLGAALAETLYDWTRRRIDADG